MDLRKYSGEITAFAHRSAGRWTNYEILEINGETLQNITGSSKLDLYIKTGVVLDVWIYKSKYLVALSRGEKIIIANFKKPGKLSLIVGIITIPWAGAGLFILYNRNKLLKAYEAIEKGILPNYKEFVNLT